MADLNITIEYCNSWGYYPRALQLEARIKQAHPDAHVELERSSGGVFEVMRNGELIYSKRATGLHPTWKDIESKL